MMFESWRILLKNEERLTTEIRYKEFLEQTSLRRKFRTLYIKSNGRVYNIRELR